jgi:hypothetical protein
MPKRKRATFEQKQKLALQRDKLISNLATGNFNSLKDRVAFILNHYPETRDSNITLAIRYYEVFHPEDVKDGCMELESFYRLPKMYDMQRVRAIVQNDYGLFLASEPVRQRRMQLAEDARQEYGNRDRDVLPTLSVFSDESGKDRDYVVLGTIWFLNANRMLELSNALSSWRQQTPGCPEEFKFSELTYGVLPLARDFFNLALNQTDTVGFKAVALRSGNTQSKHDEVVYRLYYETVMRGIQFETSRNRVGLPRIVFLTKDEDPSSDALWCAETERKLAADCRRVFEGVEIASMSTLDSRQHEPLQLADLFSGSVSRVLNRASTGTRNQKDEFAEYVCRTLSIDSATLEVNPGTDWVMTHVFDK